MIEKDTDSEVSAIFVEASTGAASKTECVVIDNRSVGAAIHLMESKLEDRGIVIQLPPKKKQVHENETKREADGKLLLLPAIVKIGIVAAIDSGLGSLESVGAVSSETALVPGNVVALSVYSYRTFLRVKEGKADCGGGKKDVDMLPLDWDSERFLVVDAGEGQVAFYSISHRLFLGMDKNGAATVSNGDGRIMNLDERSRGNESFVPVNHGDGVIQFYCGAMDMYLQSLDRNNNFYVVQVHGFE